MNFEDRLSNKIGKDTGFRVPEGYFDNAFERIGASLPEKEAKPHIQISRWQRFKPYIYLAAMFAGIWCMMKVISTTLPHDPLSLDTMQTQVAQVIDEPQYDYIIESYSPLEEIDLIEEVAGNYGDMDEFRNDFDYQLEKEYADLDVSSYLPDNNKAAEKDLAQAAK